MRSWFLRLLVRSTQKWGGEVPTLDVLKEIDNCEKKCLEFKVSSNPGFHIWTWIKTSLKIPSVNDLYYCLCFLLKLNPGAKSISDLPLYQKSCSKWWKNLEIQFYIELQLVGCLKTIHSTLLQVSQVPSSSSRSPSLLGSSVCKSSKNTTMNDIGSQRNDLPLPLSFFGHQVIKQRISLLPIQADNSEIPNQVIGRANFSRSCALFSTKLAAFKNSYPIFWGPRACVGHIQTRNFR